MEPGINTGATFGECIYKIRRHWPVWTFVIQFLQENKYYAGSPVGVTDSESEGSTDAKTLNSVKILQAMILRL